VCSYICAVLCVCCAERGPCAGQGVETPSLESREVAQLTALGDAHQVRQVQYEALHRGPISVTAVTSSGSHTPGCPAQAPMGPARADDRYHDGAR
jgi:hypothetical protein